MKHLTEVKQKTSRGAYKGLTQEFMADLVDTKDFLREAKKSAPFQEIGQGVYVDLVLVPDDAPFVGDGNILSLICTLGSYLIFAIIAHIFKAL
jgi:hypothetical protein